MTIINRRAALAGLALAPVAATVIPVHAQPGLSEGTSRVHAAAAELSRALAELDSPLQWKAEVHPAWQGHGIFSIEELHLSPEIVLERSLSSSLDAMVSIYGGQYEIYNRNKHGALILRTSEEYAL